MGSDLSEGHLARGALHTGLRASGMGGGGLQSTKLERPTAKGSA